MYFVFTPSQLIDNMTLVRGCATCSVGVLSDFYLGRCILHVVATPSVTRDLGFHALIRKMRVSSRFNMRKFDIILSFEVFSIPTQECTEILSVHHHLDLFISRKILIYTILNEEKGI